MAKPTKEQIEKHLSYDPSTGVFRWRTRSSDIFPSSWNKTAEANAASWNKQYAGTIAGGKTSKGYVLIGISKSRFYAHQAAVLMMTGEWPVGDVDHANGDKSDNRWLNLRLASRAQNNTNSKLRKDSSTGLKGVSFHKRKGKYEAKICIDGRQTRLGYFKCPLKAHEAYVRASQEHFGEFARAK